MDMLTLAAAAIAGGALLKALEPLPELSVTKHGPNQFSVGAVVRVLAYAPYWYAARRLVAGTITSAYRDARVNEIVGGVPNSDHVRGLAVDIVPGGDYWRAVRTLRAAVASGALGPVRQFIAESYKAVVHLGYYDLGKAGPVTYLEQHAPGSHRPLEA